VAITIIGIGLVMVMQLFSAGLRSARTSCDYTRAVVHAKDKMEELSDTLVGDSGEFEDGFRWEMEVQDYNPPILESSDAEESSYTLMKLIVKIYWPDVMQRQKAYELVSIKMNDTEDTL
jgi:general secretion pathway protein I